MQSGLRSNAPKLLAFQRVVLCLRNSVAWTHHHPALLVRSAVKNARPGSRCDVSYSLSSVRMLWYTGSIELQQSLARELSHE
jgi:hypothetical protein